MLFYMPYGGQRSAAKLILYRPEEDTGRIEKDKRTYIPT